jgi:hypothetical protein
MLKARNKKPVHLIDGSIVIEQSNGEKDYQRVSISKDMAEKGIPVEVVNSGFIQSYYSDAMNVLELWQDIVAAKKAHDEYYKTKQDDQKVADISKKEVEDANAKAILAAKKAFDESMKLSQDKRSEKPKVVRRKAGEE